MRAWLGLWLVSASALAATIPPTPTGDDYVYDSANLLLSSDLQQVRNAQLEALNRYNSPIVVVTIESVNDYGALNVEELARRWFDAWHIGTLGLERGANQGMLLLVAVRDRKARIELGADWGHDWDDHAQDIMSGTIVPRFKSGDYSGGIALGVQSMLAMAKTGPHSQPPGDFIDRRVKRMTKYSLLDPKPFLAMIGAGIVLVLVGAFAFKPPQKWMIVVGVGLILFAAFTYVVIVLVLVAVRLLFPSRRGWSSGGGGGGFSGGFSGGGGASGSW